MTTEIETPVVSGEVVTTNESSAAAKAALLKENEGIIKRNWKAATEKANKVYEALTIIHTYDLWKLHLDAKGKRKYTNFETYLSQEFGWTLTRVRALQVIKATRAQMIEAGTLPASTATPRQRTAPEVTSEKAAKVSADQLEKVIDAFASRVDSIDDGDPDKAAVLRIYNDVSDAVRDAVADLREIAAAAEAATSSDDAADDDDDDDDDETATE